MERLKIYLSSAEHKEHIKRINADPEYQAKRLEHLKRLHASMKGRIKPEVAGKPSVQLEVLDTLNNFTTVYPSMSEAARAIGVTDSAISQAFKSKGL